MHTAHSESMSFAQTKGTILVVDDDQSLRDALSTILDSEGYQVTVVANVEEALTKVFQAGQEIDLIISDIHMQPTDGLALLRSVQAASVDIPVMLMTAYGSVSQAVEAMHSGASDYLVKPFDVDELLHKVTKAIRPQMLNDDYIFGDPLMQEVVAMARRVAESEATVMISGKSGVGKEVMARYIHAQSARADKQFVAINCAAIPENMLEAILFGYEKGAFTGAIKTTPGKFEQAQHGTLLLDEISEMDLSLQAKLLRVIQEREVERIGGRDTISLDVRILATTNRNLRDEVRAGRFREDLYYRLNVFPIRLPSLAERPGDLLPIAELLIAKHTPRGAGVKTLSEGVVQRLLAHDWPGNVRELENVVQRALVLCGSSQIDTHHILFERDEQSPQEPIQTDGRLCSDLKSREVQLIVETLRQCTGSRKLTAERLGISARTLRYKLARMRELGIDIPESQPMSA